jgi:hypothetical protein
MRQDLDEIANRLAQLSVPQNLISVHLKRVEPKSRSLKRHRLNRPDDNDDSKSKRQYQGARAVFRKG